MALLHEHCEQVGTRLQEEQKAGVPSCLVGALLPRFPGKDSHGEHGPEGT